MKQILDSKSSKGRQIKIVDNNRYRFVGNNKHGQLWRCMEKSCRGKLHTDKAGGYIKSSNHNHKHQESKEAADSNKNYNNNNNNNNNNNINNNKDEIKKFIFVESLYKLDHYYPIDKWI